MAFEANGTGFESQSELLDADRNDLLDVETIENNQNNLLETFNRYVNRTRGQIKQSNTYPIPSSQCWPRIIMTLTELRSVTMCAQDLFSQTSGTTTTTTTTNSNNNNNNNNNQLP
ncbi:unnamed protein product [Schistosoma curassoni]|uniref:Uncharacterized protein n=1 Tax=Schistosoma curassoni TaxID=6186 RepID=A0A183KT70_9TREM|nr:unnamed protein product [Schistosoma curassoni]